MQDWVSKIPVLGGPLSAVLWPARVAESFVKIFVNWRYVVEVIFGAGLMLVGIVLIVGDTKPGRQAGQAAAVAAVAA